MPDTYTGTFTRPCLDCGTTIHVVDTVEQPHDCRPPVQPTEDTRALVARAYWNGHDTALANRQPGDPDYDALKVVPGGGDPGPIATT